MTLKTFFKPRYILLIIIAMIALYCSWWSFLYYPDDYADLKKEASETKNPEHYKTMDISLLDKIDTASWSAGYAKTDMIQTITSLTQKGYFCKEEPFVKNKSRIPVFRFGTGYPGIWMDERTSIMLPNGEDISFPVDVKPGSVLEFSAIAIDNDGKLTTSIKENGTTTTSIVNNVNLNKYVPKYSCKDVKNNLINVGFKKARDKTEWIEYKIDLSEFSGKKISINFKGDCKNGSLFLANPRIFANSERKRYNVVYIIFDGVATDYFSFYNNKSKLTPFMKKVADKNFTVFENMITLGDKTRISTTGLFTSMIPTETGHGINRNYIPEAEKDFFYERIRRGEIATLPDAFRRNGYVTEQFGNSGFTVHLLSTGIDYGFSRSYEFSYNMYNNYGISHRFFKFLRDNKDREFFTYIHYNTTHKPFHAPLSHYFKGIIFSPFKALYRPTFLATISYSDDIFKNIYRALESNGLLENTIVVLATDHGAGINIDKLNKGFQYNDFIRMSFMIHIPEKLKEQLRITKNRVQAYMSSINTAPTLTALAGLKNEPAFEGKNMTETMTDSFNKEFYDKEIWSFGRKTASIITEDKLKYTLTFPDTEKLTSKKYTIFGPQMDMPYERIYDLQNDPNEMNNLSGIRKDLLKKFRDLYLLRDYHHREKNVLTFMPSKKGFSSIEVETECSSKLMESGLYDKKYKLIKDELKTLKNDDRALFSFNIANEPLYLIFEMENDRAPLKITVRADGKTIPVNNIVATDMDMNLFENPIQLNDKNDFYILNSTRLPDPSELPISDETVTVKVSRIDLHRWIDVGGIEKQGLSAGMKETLKSWGYIQ